MELNRNLISTGILDSAVFVTNWFIFPYCYNDSYVNVLVINRFLTFNRH